MDFKKALELMQEGKLVKLPSWGGYWCWDKENKTIMIHTKEGKVLDIRETQVVEYTTMNILSDEWILADEENTPVLGGEATFNFGEALKYLKRGHKVTRQGWNGKGMFVVYQKAYPQGIPCNKQTAEAWGLNEGDLFKCEPYLQIKMANGSHAMWVPSINDVLAEDWRFV